MPPLRYRRPGRAAPLTGLLVLLLLSGAGPAAGAAAPTGYRDGPAEPVPSAPASARAAAAGPSAAPAVRAGVNQYSPPEWLPLRNAATVGCVNTNCTIDGAPYHNYWAVDLLDPNNLPGAPIYAAGAGKLHIISAGGTACGTSLNTPVNAVSIDHGNGVTSVYYHLDSILATEGQWVDTTTEIGTMGHGGYTFPCPPGANHLHYEKRVNGTRVDPGPLKACSGNTVVTYPQALGYPDWDNIPPYDFTVQSDGTACGGASVTGHPPADFTGDGRTDLSVFRPSAGAWFVSGGSPSSVVFGVGGDIPVNGDYNGDGKAEPAVYRSPATPGSAGVWYLSGPPAQAVPFGVTGDIPVPADYDGDGKTDIAVFRPSNGVWYIGGSSPAAIAFGVSGDVPVPGDYDGDGKADVAVFRPSAGVWYVGGTAALSPQFGVAGDIPVPADYDGDGRTDVAVYRPSNHAWYVGGTSPSATVFGTAGDVPQPGDYDGDGKADVAVFRPSTRVWYTSGASPSATAWGASGDFPVVLPPAIYRTYF